MTVKAPLPLDAAVAYWHACAGIPYVPTYVQITVDPDCPRSIGGYIVNERRFRDFYENHVNPDAPIDVSTIPADHDPFCPPMDPMLDLPKHERRQYGVRSVRQWFRTLRAADFTRDVRPDFRIGLAEFMSSVPPGTTIVGPGAESSRWLKAGRSHLRVDNIVDIQRVVDRETAAHYATSKESRMDGICKVCGQPHFCVTCHALLDPDSQDWFWNGDHHAGEHWACRLRRGDGPKVSEKARGITPEDIERFVREDDAHRSERVQVRRPDAYRITGITPPEGY